MIFSPYDSYDGRVGSVLPFLLSFWSLSFFGSCQEVVFHWIT